MTSQEQPTLFLTTETEADNAKRFFQEQYTGANQLSARDKLRSFRESRTEKSESPTESTTHSLLGSKGLKLLQKRKELLSSKKSLSKSNTPSQTPSTSSPSLVSAPPTPTVEQPVNTSHEPPSTPFVDDTQSVQVQQPLAPLPTISIDFSKELENINTSFDSRLNLIIGDLNLLREKILNNESTGSTIQTSISNLESKLIDLGTTVSQNHDNHVTTILSLQQQLKSLDQSIKVMENLFRSSTEGFKSRLVLIEDEISKQKRQIFKTVFWLLISYFLSGLSTVLIPITGTLYTGVGLVRKSYGGFCNGITRVFRLKNNKKM
ncbi:hypothetical protein RCL1_002856 [Eukaryota sp. TZLM3-RCL]